MTVNVNDDLEKLLGPEFRGQRYEDWLWHYLMNIGADLTEAHFGHGSRSNVAAFLRANEFFLKNVRSHIGSALVPNSYFDWLDDSAWQSDFVFDMLTSQFSIRRTCVHQSLSGRRRIIALIDGLDDFLLEKKNSIKNVKEAWSQRVADDRVFKWFEGNDEVERCQLLWEWLTEHRPEFTKGKKSFGCYQDIIYFLDKVRMSASDKELIVIKVRRNWDQRRRRQKLEGTIKQCNLELNNKTVLLLEKMAGKYGLTRAAIVDILVNDEYSKKLYIPERLRRMEALSVSEATAKVQI